MSFYNMLFGQNPLSNILLRMINVSISEIPRFRGAYIEGDVIVVYTRSGGGNDECYCETEDEHEEGCFFKANRDLEEKSNFLSFEYDDFDQTYACFRFSVLPEYAEILDEVIQLSGNNPPTTVSQKFKEFIKKTSE